MSMKTTFKIFTGTLSLAILCSGLFIYMNYKSASITSTTALLKANSVSVGAEYAGAITQQFVQVGDHVSVGEKLFYIKSSTLIQALNSSQLQQKDLLYALTPDRQLIITASNAGFISSIDYGQGSYVPISSVIATVTTDNALTLTATFKMSTTQYAQTTNGTPLDVKLPDGTTIKGRINDVSIQGQTNPLLVTVTASVKGTQNESAKAGKEGTPVTADLTLKQNTYWSKLKHWLPHR